MRDSCRELFKKLEILPLCSQYIVSISIFVIKNKHLFYTNNQIHSIHTRFKTNLHPPTANLTMFQKGVYYSAIKIFNNLLHNIKDLANEIVLFRNALKRFLLINSFYNSKEVLRRIFEPKRDEVTGEWRKLHNEELKGLYLSPNIVRVIKSRRMRWAGHVARMGEGRGV